MKHVATSILCLSLLLTAGSADAETPEFPNTLYGSDTLNQLVDELIEELIADHALSGTGYTIYAGLGSSLGGRQMEGSPLTGEPSCAPFDPDEDAENNHGCQEIAPMDLPLKFTICEDDPDPGSGANVKAEGLAVCRDGIVVITDNASLGEYGDTTTACNNYASLSNTSNTGSVFPDRGVGNLRNSGTIDLDPPGSGAEDYTIGGGSLTPSTAWKDVLRLIFTGCTNSAGTCAGADDRIERCGAEVRTKLLQDWSLLFEGVDCGATGNACNNASIPENGGLRQAYRRDDASGTALAFLELIGVSANPENVRSRQTVLSGIPLAATAMPHYLSFCDGGAVEGLLPTNFAVDGSPRFDLGDPIRKPCKPEDDLCALDGKVPVVRAIRSPITPFGESPYPMYQCSKGLFERKPYITGSTLKLCPDGTAPNAAGCKFPFYDTPVTHVQNFDCLNASNSRPSTLPASVDGRAYNFTMHLSDGTLRKASGSGSSIMPQVASWRQNMAELSTSPAAAPGFAFGPSALGDYVCTEDDATRSIGCIVGHTTCTLGLSGREAAYTSANANHLYSEPVQIQEHGPSNTEITGSTYPFARDLYVNAIHGFENISTDCANRLGSTDQCADELRIAEEFYNVGAPGNLIAELCEESGLVPLSAAVCVGAQGSAGCGAPTTQVLSACLPQ